MTLPIPHGLLRWLQLQPQRAVGALAAILAMVLCALVANDLQSDYQQQLAAASSRTSSLTQLLEEHARQSMRRVELALSLAAQAVQSEYLVTGHITPGTGTRLRMYLPEDGLIASFAVSDATGKILASTLTEVDAELPVVSDRDYFLAQQQPSQSGLFIGQAVKSRISGLWIIPVSVRLEGGLSGYLMGAVDPEYFQHLYQTIDTSEDGSVTLFTSQGWAIARWPFTSEITERNWRDAPMFKDEVTKSSAAVLRQKDAATGVDSVYSYRALQDYPLVVVLGVSRDEILRPWHERALFECTALLLILLFLGGSSAMLIVQLQRRMRAESALQLSEISVLRSSLPTLWIGQDARILRVNQAACDLHGYSEAQMLGLKVPHLNPTMPMEQWPGHWQRLRKARNMRFETVHRTQQGEEVPVEVELNFIEFGGQEYNFSFIRDLRLRKRAETEIQRSAALLRSAIDAMDEAFVLFDTDDRMVYCNAKYTELYPAMKDVVVPGARFEDMIRIGAERGLYRESIGRKEEWIAQRLQAHLQGNESRIQKRDDGRVMRVIDRKTKEGNIAGIRVDITEMVKATEEAQEASRYKSQFLANMSHEIRTPMNAILGLLALLQNTALSPTQRDYASKTEGAAQSLLHLLNDILDFSKVEAGKMELDLQPFRLDRMLRDISVILSSNMAGKPIEVLFDIDPAVPAVVVADAMRLQQVLVNLGGNAIKFTAEGQVVLRVSRLPMPDAPTSQETLLEFSIQDSGIGIAADQQEHIFTGFSQAEASTTRRFGGTGLGLAISRRLVELMGGRLGVQSAPGQGSTFSFTLRLPLAGDDPLAAPEAPRQSPPAMRVLVVDNNPVAREILAAMTRSWSWPTQLADSGAQALELIRSQSSADSFPFDVIYLDWQMPGMDGWDAARQIRALSQGFAPQPWIVMLSANGHDSLQLRTPQEQALINGFLFKPFTASTLQDAALDPAASSVQTYPVQRSSQRPLAGLRILVVEDNLINQQVAEELLGAEGALVSLAANGQLGVDAVVASQPPFDVVLMDIQMPVLDGFGATRKIRQELGMQALPIVAMTANAMASDRLACLEAGMNEHVGKPFDMKHLVAMLLNITGRKAPVQTALPLAAPLSAEAIAPKTCEALMFSNAYLDVAPALERIAGMTQLYVDIAQDFVQALDAVEGEFRQAAKTDQTAALSSQMHTLKGTAATLGADRLSRQAAVLEKLFQIASPELNPLEHLPEFMELVGHTRAAMLQAVDSLQGSSQDFAAAKQRESDPAQRARAKTFLTQLAELLAVSNLEVLDQFARRGNVLQPVPTEQLAALQAALGELDLERARQLCERYASELA
jgi:two-component system, sensor histidine kinase and response regulator